MTSPDRQNNKPDTNKNKGATQVLTYTQGLTGFVGSLGYFEKLQRNPRTKYKY